MKRLLRISLMSVVVVLCAGYILRKVDVERTGEVIADAQPWWIAAAASIFLLTMIPMAWRWKVLLKARGVHERVPWLARAYLVSYAVGQVLPTSVGGDAARIYELVRRRPGHASEIAGSVLVERAIGGVVTLLVAAIGLLLALGRFPVGAYLWVELVLAIAATAGGVLFFSRRVRRRLAVAVPIARRLGVERFARAVYEGVHGYRSCVRQLLVVAVVTFFVHVGGIVAIYACARAVDIDVSLLAYPVFGPLLFLVTLMPFTINGLAVREAFFVSFFGHLDVPAEQALACGLAYFLSTLVLALGGILVMLWRGVVPAAVTDRPA